MCLIGVPSPSPYARLKTKSTEQVLQDYGRRARKLEGEKLSLDAFALYLDMPDSDMLRETFALFSEVCVCV